MRSIHRRLNTHKLAALAPLAATLVALTSLTAPSLQASSVVIQSAENPPKGTLLATYNFSASQFELDAANHRLYATVPSLNSVAVIDTQSLSLITTVFVGSNPSGMGLSENGDRLYIGNRGSTVNAVAVFDTQTLTVVANHLLPVPATDIAVGKNNLVYASPYESATSHGIMVLNGLTGQLHGEIAPRHASTGGLLEMSPDRMTLLEQEIGSSPADVYKFSLSGTTGTLAWSKETGSAGRDLAISHDGQFFAAPNSAPYDIKLLRMSDGQTLGTLYTGAYPREIAFSPDDLYAYLVHTSGEIDVFSTSTFLSLGPMSVIGQADELLVDDSGQFLFASFENQTRVYATGIVPEPATATLAVLFGVGVIVGRRFLVRAVPRA